MRVMVNDRNGTAGVGLAIISAGSFGMSGALARGLLDTGWSAGAVVLARIAIAAVVVAPFAAADLRGRWGAVRRHAPLVAIYGAVPIALAQFAYFSAVVHMAVGPALLIEYTAPAAVVAWLWLRRGERPTGVTLAGAAVIALGLTLVLDLLSGPNLSVVGVLWALVAMTGAATYFLLGTGATADVPPLGLAGCGLAVGAVCVALLGALGVLPMRAATLSASYAGVTVAWWAPLIGLGVITAALAYCTGIAAIRRLGSRVASFFGLLEVVSGVAFAWLLLDQVPGPVQFLGGALIMAGIVVIKLGEPAPPASDLQGNESADQPTDPAGERVMQPETLEPWLVEPSAAPGSGRCA